VPAAHVDDRAERRKIVSRDDCLTDSDYVAFSDRSEVHEGAEKTKLCVWERVDRRSPVENC